MDGQVQAPKTPELVSLEARHMRIPCPTCKAAEGEPCDKRGNLRRGGAYHLTRGDRLFHGTYSHHYGKHCARNWLMTSGRALPVDWLVYQSTGVDEKAMQRQLDALRQDGLAKETPDGWLWVDIADRA